MVIQQKIFVTGITSELMQNFVQLIDKDKYKIYGLTRSLRSGCNSDVTYVVGNILKPETFNNYLSNCSILIHAAAITHSFRKDGYYKVNLEATKNLVDLAIQYDVKKMVYVSSNTASEKNGTYSLTKFLSEKYLEDKLETWLILKPSEVYGGNKGVGIDKYLSYLLQKSIAFYPTGVPTKLYPVYIKDAAEVMHQLIFEQKKLNEKISICGPEGYSFLELVNLVEEFKGRRITVLPIPKKLMFLMEKLTEILPFFIGVIPDQIPRLYGAKDFSSTEKWRGTKTIEHYLKEISQ